MLKQLFFNEMPQNKEIKPTAWQSHMMLKKPDTEPGKHHFI
jgi:hypothetical protein